MKSQNNSYDDRAVITFVTKTTEKDIESYYDFDLDGLYKLNESKRKKASREKKEESNNVNRYIEEQLALGVPEDEVRQRVTSYLRTLNHNRKVISNNEEREVFTRLEKRLNFEETAIEAESVIELFKSLPGVLPSGMPPESLHTAAQAYAMALLRADEKERNKFYAKLDDILFSRMLMLNAVIIFRKCLDMEISTMINEHRSREEIEKVLRQRIEEYKLMKKMPYSLETITRAKVLAKIDNLESGVETYIDEEDYVSVPERLKFIRMNIRAARNARRLEMSRENKKQ